MKTSELTRHALNWAVDKCNFMQHSLESDYCLEVGYAPLYSTDWAQGGPIIEREWLQVTPWPNESDEDLRWHCVQHDSPVQRHAYGPTPLIAAMRCYVASQLGDEIDLPKEMQ